MNPAVLLALLLALPGASALAQDEVPRTPVPPITEADRAAAAPPPHAHGAHDDSLVRYLAFDRLEAWDSRDGSGLSWETKAWVGKDTERLWLRSEGEKPRGDSASGDLELLYGRAVSPWWDAVVGLRHDFGPDGSRDLLALGVMGLAPYKFEVQATLYAGSGGDTSARVEADYELLLSNRLILQPRIEFNLEGRGNEDLNLGSGLSTAEAGLRLRYEITRQVAPYIGVSRERAFGGTAGLRQQAGEPASETRWMLGLRLWF